MRTKYTPFIRHAEIVTYKALKYAPIHVICAPDTRQNGSFTLHGVLRGCNRPKPEGSGEEAWAGGLFREGEGKNGRGKLGDAKTVTAPWGFYSVRRQGFCRCGCKICDRLPRGRLARILRSDRKSSLSFRCPYPQFSCFIHADFFVGFHLEVGSNGVPQAPPIFFRYESAINNG